MFLLWTFVTIVSGLDEDNANETIVTLDCGRIQGIITNTTHGSIKEFMQIPYALPPIGERRWTHSELLKPNVSGPCWTNEIYNASYQRSIKCVQYWNGTAVQGQEDCLYLSVRTPAVPGERLPVVVWVHGGGLIYGWCDEPGYSPTAEFTADLNVVTVNINYRLDVMGFLSTPEIWNDGVNYGNFGFSDVITALNWVKFNIAKFRGDPDSITLLGESSGATIILGLLASPLAEGLFHKAISLSPAPKWESTYRDAYSRRSSYVADVGCGNGTLAERRTCLKLAPIEALSRHRDLKRGDGFYDFPLGAGLPGESMDCNVIEPTIVSISPTEIYKLRAYKHKPKIKLILSNTAQETGYITFQSSKNQLYNWTAAHNLLKDRLENMWNILGKRGSIDWLVRDIEYVYDFEMDSQDHWWPQIYWDTLTTDIRATCRNNILTESINSNRQFEVYRLYIKHRPKEFLNGLRYDSIHGWDTEALFDFGYYNLASSHRRHQRRFQTNMRDLVGYFAYGREMKGWNKYTTLVMENADLPYAVVLDERYPQHRECWFWNRLGFLRYGWEN